MKFLALLFLCACFRGGHGLPEDVQPFSTELGARQITRVAKYLTSQDWEQTGWWRPGDFFVDAIYVVITSDNFACLVPAEVYTVAHDGSFVTCHSSWRNARP